MITQRRLKELLSYDRDTGEFRWKWRKRGSPQWNGHFAGKVAGGSDPSLGYWQIRIGDKLYYAHRLAWLYVYGRWPESQIDHVNLKRSDNRIVNLREATRAQNMMNGSLRADNSSGYTGVWFSKQIKRWIAEVCIDRRKIHVGTFKSLEEAVAARNVAAKEHHGDFARLP